MQMKRIARSSRLALTRLLVVSLLSAAGATAQTGKDQQKDQPFFKVKRVPPLFSSLFHVHVHIGHNREPTSCFHCGVLNLIQHFEP